MKKIMISFFTLSVAVAIIYGVLSFEYKNSDIIEGSLSAVQITKDASISNTEYIAKLEAVVQSCGTDILYKSADPSSTKITRLYYKTSNNPDFLSLSVEGDSIILSKGECLSTHEVSDYICRRIYGGNLIENIEIYPFDLIVDKDLSCSLFYIDKDMKTTVFSALKDAGFEVASPTGGGGAVSDLSSILIAYLMVITFFVLGVAFYAASKNKDILIKKLHGYSTADIICCELFSTYRLMLSLFAGILLLVLLGLTCFYEIQTACLFLSFFWIYLLAEWAFFTVCFVIAIAYVVSRCEVTAVKGRNGNRQLFWIAIAAQSVIFVILLSMLSGALANLNETRNIQSTYKKVADKVSHYARFVEYSLGTDTMARGDEINQELINLYNLTVNDFNGVLMNCYNYFWRDDYNMTYADSSGNREILVNENYLKINPVYAPDGSLIDMSVLSDSDCVYFLACEGSNTEDIVKQYALRYSIPENSVTVLFYKEDQTFLTFNANIGKELRGVITNPVVMIYNEKYFGYNMEAYFSNGFYFVSIPDGETPYEVLLPYLIDSKTADILLETPYISDEFSNEISRVQTEMISYLILAAFYILTLCATLLYTARLYCTEQGKNICVKRLHGFSFLPTHRWMLRIKALLYVAEIAVCLMIACKWWLLLISILGDYLVFWVCIKRFEKISISNIVKGDN